MCIRDRVNLKRRALISKLSLIFSSLTLPVGFDGIFFGKYRYRTIKHEINFKNLPKKFDGYKRTRRFITIGSPHKGTLASQLIPKYPFKGISEMKINSLLLRELSRSDYLLSGIDCISFFTYWDLMVFPGWRASLNSGEKISLKIYKHKNLVRNPNAIDKIVDRLLN